MICQKSGCNIAKNGISSSLPTSIFDMQIIFVIGSKWSKLLIGPNAPNAGPTFPNVAILPVNPVIALCSIIVISKAEIPNSMK